ncbi:LolA family protein [Salegentibacter chungangensis]|uniref:Outer membrane lipoprotein carrier protein LolA n=1 Tax=Salegentibacter chungangensis TaxID=1335724 RepID=A0ABW3NSK5_9FLAO
MRILKFLIFFISLNVFSQHTPLNEVAVKEFKVKTAEKAAALKSLSGDFIQSKHMAMIEEKAESKGKFYYRSPDILKWEYVTPYDYRVLFKNDKLYLNDEGHKSVTDAKSNKLIEKLAKLISGSVNGKLLEDNENFSTEYYRHNDQFLVKMIPRDENLSHIFRELLMVFDEDLMVRSVKLKDESGDFTKIEFKNLKVNQPIPDSVFQN